MLKLFWLVCVSSLGLVFANEAVQKAFTDNEILADLKLSQAPADLLEVSYPSGVSADLGNELTPTKVKDIPTLKWKFEDGKLYTVLMTDPDAPSRATPNFREVRHWLVLNVPYNDFEQGDTIFEYIGSGAPKNTGLHRYILLVFEQEERIDTDEIIPTRNCSREGRLMSSTEELVKQYKLGKIVAGNFFQAQYDEYVPILHQQLSVCQD